MKILIFAGGNGTRLWPVSRISTPKQFLKLFDNNTKCLFELTIERLLKRFDIKDIIVVVPEYYKKDVMENYPLLSEDNIIIEPTKWDTLACVGYASFIVSKKYTEDNVFICWSDHIIKDEEKFLDIIQAGDIYATEHRKIIRLGAVANYPETNFGYLKYIKTDKTRIDSLGIDIYGYGGHIEKPDIDKATELFESGDYLWNMGYMIWPSGLITDFYKKYSIETFNILNTILENNIESDEILELYKKIKKTSIDFEILEKLDNSSNRVIPVDVSWNDVGDWRSLKSQLEDRQLDNVYLHPIDNILNINSVDTLVYSKDKNKEICIVGLNDIAIVDTGDCLLVCSKKHSKELKQVVDILKDKKPELL